VKRAFIQVPPVVLVGILLAASAADARGETDRLSPLRIGAHASLTRAIVGGQAIEESRAVRSAIYGPAVGGFARIHLAHIHAFPLGLQFGVAYAPRGADATLGGDVSSFRAEYLEMPMLVRLDADISEPFGLYLAAGVTTGLLLTAEQTDTDGQVFDRKEDTRNVDVGLSAAIGATLTVTSKVSTLLEARYTQGFLTIQDPPENEILNRAIYISLGIEVAFGGDSQ